MSIGICENSYTSTLPAVWQKGHIRALALLGSVGWNLPLHLGHFCLVLMFPFMQRELSILGWMVNMFGQYNFLLLFFIILDPFGFQIKIAYRHFHNE
jgi:hypothetical protein